MPLHTYLDQDPALRRSADDLPKKSRLPRVEGALACVSQRQDRELTGRHDHRSCSSESGIPEVGPTPEREARRAVGESYTSQPRRFPR